MRAATIICFLGLFAIATAPSAAAARDLVGARATALGGSLRATAQGSAAPLLNPAGMSLGRTYVINGGYQYRASDDASQLNASIVDSLTSAVAAGISYTFVHATPERTLAVSGDSYALEETLDTHELGLSLSYSLGGSVLLGMTGKWIRHAGELPTDAPEGLATPDISQITLDVGGILRLGKALHLGVVGYHLVEVDDPGFPRSLGLGVGYQAQTILLEFDSVLDFSSDPDQVQPSFHGGIEFLAGGSYALRGGVIHDRLRQASYVSGGAGLRSRRFVLDLGLRQMVDGGAETLFSLAMQAFFSQ